jgi:zinc transport system substrate-binding protein
MALLAVVACVGEGEKSGKPSVFVSLLPQKFIVDQLAGGLLEVGVLVPPGANHETFEPSPQDMIRLRKATVFLKTGLFPFEEMLLRQIPESDSLLHVVNTSEGMDLLVGACSGHHQHDEIHDHGSPDPHIWLSLVALKSQASVILESLIRVLPKEEALLRNNHRKFVLRADSLHAVLQAHFQKKKVHSFMIFHPALGYFARDYQLNQLSIEQEGKNPAPHKLKELIDEANRENVRVILVQKEFDTENARIIANETGATIQTFDPLSYDLFDNFAYIAGLISGEPLP